MGLTLIAPETLRFDPRGLIPVVVQDAVSGEVLMVAWTNAEALDRTAETGEMVFFSRSRGELWHKGETSGHRMTVRELRRDCDGDTVLALVDPQGPACHTGETSCFHRPLSQERTADPAFLGHLWRFLRERRNASPETSYTARLLASGLSRVAQKVGEEGVETALAVALGKKEEAIFEGSDLLYHLLVALVALDIPLDALWNELASRHHAAASAPASATETSPR